MDDTRTTNLTELTDRTPHVAESAAPRRVGEGSVVPIRARRRRRRARPEWEGRSLITVGSLPGRSVYVRHLGHPEGVDGVHRPTVHSPGSTRRPAAAFDPRWFERHLQEIDIVEVEALPPRMTPDMVTSTIETIRAAGRPLVVTAYHLTDPTGADPAQYAARLDALIPAADAVVTMTPGAAAEITRRWGANPIEVRHPHAVDFVRMRQGRTPANPAALRVGAHLGSLGGGTESFVKALTEAVSRVPGALLRVYLHDHVLDPESSRYDAGRARELDIAVRRVGGVLTPHRPLTESQTWDQLFGLDVSVVPPLHGSHSVWPEACHDLGTQVLLPDDVHAVQQQRCLTYGHRTVRGTGRVPDADSMTAALLRAVEIAREREVPRATPSERWEQRMTVSESYRTLYEHLLGR